VVAACLCAGSALADEAEVQGPTWATVNSCVPGAFGVRASLPGTGRGTMSARMSAEWLDPATGGWKPVEGASSSPWLSAGSSDVRWTQVGWTFQIPAGGYRLRGVAELRWSSGRTRTLITSGGAMTSSGVSLATCSLGAGNRFKPAG
jgi:hypothetical protein